jgi:hypothetical protein
VSLFSIGKNELKELQKRKEYLDMAITECDKNFGTEKNICNFQKIMLENQRGKLHAQISVMEYMYPEDDNDSA